jgi:hypothetical protein
VVSPGRSDDRREVVDLLLEFCSTVCLAPLSYRLSPPRWQPCVPASPPFILPFEIDCSFPNLLLSRVLAKSLASTSLCFIIQRRSHILWREWTWAEKKQLRMSSIVSEVSPVSPCSVTGDPFARSSTLTDFHAGLQDFRPAPSPQAWLLSSKRRTTPSFLDPPGSPLDLLLPVRCFTTLCFSRTC